MERWLGCALDQVPRWIEYQMRLTEQPGCALAVALKDEVVLEAAFGHADLARRVPLTPRHRFRVASQSKTFTAAGVLKLCERHRMRLDDPVGMHVGGLSRRIASVTIAQLLAHGGGLARDGDTAHWYDRGPFPDEVRLRAALARARVIEPDARFKYSNLGYGLLGLAIEARGGERYAPWMAREVIAAADLGETLPDMPLPGAAPFASGHGAKLPLGRRVVVPGANETLALAPATGFVSTASDLARFYASLGSQARNRWLSAASRRAMLRRLWRDSQTSAERWYGLGTISGTLAGWDWFGHSGAFQGTITRTLCVPARGLTISVLTNAVDGAAHAWVDGIVQILAVLARHGAPSRSTAPWRGRWWTPWGAIDLVPTRTRVFVANPALGDPFLDAIQLAPMRAIGADRTHHARVVEASGFGNMGEPARLLHDAHGRARALWLAGTELKPERAVARELVARYEAAATTTAAAGRSTPTARRRSSTSYGLCRNAS
ncbi:MAG TPA: serine hydrolase domain-containing protein [Caldimonas sp.]|nr:serine hydrolase domain-containing protein [Caldimonas sp.]